MSAPTTGTMAVSTTTPRMAPVSSVTSTSLNSGTSSKSSPEEPEPPSEQPANRTPNRDTVAKMPTLDIWVRPNMSLLELVGRPLASQAPAALPSAGAGGEPVDGPSDQGMGAEDQEPHHDVEPVEAGAGPGAVVQGLHGAPIRGALHEAGGRDLGVRRRRHGSGREWTGWAGRDTAGARLADREG